MPPAVHAGAEWCLRPSHQWLTDIRPWHGRRWNNRGHFMFCPARGSVDSGMDKVACDLQLRQCPLYLQLRSSFGQFIFTGKMFSWHIKDLSSAIFSIIRCDLTNTFTDIVCVYTFSICFFEHFISRFRLRGCGHVLHQLIKFWWCSGFRREFDLWSFKGQIQKWSAALIIKQPTMLRNLALRLSILLYYRCKSQYEGKWAARWRCALYECFSSCFGHVVW